MKKIVFAIIPPLLLAACGSSEEQKVYGPDDYKHFSPYFTMNESANNEMGTAPAGEMAPVQQDPSTVVLSRADAGVDANMSANITAPVPAPVQ